MKNLGETSNSLSSIFAEKPYSKSTNSATSDLRTKKGKYKTSLQQDVYNKTGENLPAWSGNLFDQKGKTSQMHMHEHKNVIYFIFQVK